MAEPMSNDTEMQLRADCCADWPKPCGYHEGYLDGYEARDIEVEPLRAENEKLQADIEKLQGVLIDMTFHAAALEGGDDG